MLEWLEMHELPCLFKALLGVECPGCGFQRSLFCLLKGEIGASFCLWPPMLFLLFYLGVITVRCAGVEKISPRLLKNLGFVCLITILSTYLLKLIVNNY